MKNGVSWRSCRQTRWLRVRVHGIGLQIRSLLCITGHYRALEWADSTKQYVLNEELGIIVEVEVRLEGASTNRISYFHRKWKQRTSSRRLEDRLTVALPSHPMNQATTLFVSPPTTRHGFQAHTSSSIWTSW